MSLPGPPSSSPASYEHFYGLAEPPFALAPDARFFYPGASHDTAIRLILESLRQRDGVVMLSGEIGTGKTTTCHALQQRLGRATLSSLILNPFLSLDDLLRQVVRDFGVEDVPDGRLASAGTSVLATLLAGRLDQVAPRGRRRNRAGADQDAGPDGHAPAEPATAVIVLDEAQLLTPRVLEELHDIVGLVGQEGRLQVVLAGQPKLLPMLATPAMEAIARRVTRPVALTPLDREDVREYIAHRLTVAGHSVSVLFAKSAVRRVHELSGGIPRTINVLCDRALATGAERGVHDITAEIVDRAADALAVRRLPAPVPQHGPRYERVIRSMFNAFPLTRNRPASTSAPRPADAPDRPARPAASDSSSDEPR